MSTSDSKLGFNGAWSMAVGGMVGGGIFSTLGVVVGNAGSSAEAENHGVGAALFGAASVFMAYEGFQLLTYDYEDIVDPNEKGS